MPCNCCEMENNTFGEATSPLAPLLKGEGDPFPCNKKSEANQLRIF